MGRRITFRVSLVLPEGARRDDAKEYVLEAVQTWRGQLRPPGALGDFDEGDAMHALDADTVEVT